MSVEIPIDFIARFENSVKDLKGFADQTQKEVKRIQSNFEGLKDIVGLVFGAAIVKKGFDSIADGFSTVTKAGAEYETEVVRLGQSLRLTGEFSEEALSTFIALGDEMQLNTKYAGGEIVSQIALAKSYGLTNKETEKLIRASVDLSAATGKDLNTSTELLAKTYSGQAGLLGKMVLGVNTLTQEQLLNGKAVDLVAKAYGGSANSELKTYNGVLASIANNYEDFLESIGRPITESGSVRAFLEEINNLLVDASGSVTENAKAISEFMKSVITGSLIALGGLIELSRAFDNIFRIIYRIGQGVVDVFQVVLDKANILTQLLTGNFSGALDTVLSKFKETNQLADDAKAAADRYDKLFNILGNVYTAVENASDATTKLADGAGVVSTKFDDSGKSIKRFGKDLKTDFESLVKELEKNVGNPIDNLTASFGTNTKLIQNSIKAGLTNQVRGEELIGKLRLQYEKQVGEEREKQLDLERKRFQELVGRLKEITANPLRIFAGGQDNRGNSLGLSEGQQSGAAAGLGGIQQILGGAEGARKFLASAGAAVGTAFLGPAGEALGPIIEILSKGPEEVKKIVREFAQAIPDLIQNIIEALPEVFIELADQLPLIIERLVDRAPEIIQRLVERVPEIAAAFIRNIPRIILALTTAIPAVAFELAKNMGPVIGKFIEGAFRFTGKLLEGAAQFTGKILEGAVNFIGEIISGAGRFIDELIKGIGNIGGGGGFLGTGIGGSGGIIPDSVPIIGGWFKAGAETYAGNMMSEKSGGGGSQQVSVSVEISRKQLAEAILEINQMGYRTA